MISSQESQESASSSLHLYLMDESTPGPNPVSLNQTQLPCSATMKNYIGPQTSQNAQDSCSLIKLSQSNVAHQKNPRELPAADANALKQSSDTAATVISLHLLFYTPWTRDEKSIQLKVRPNARVSKVMRLLIAEKLSQAGRDVSLDNVLVIYGTASLNLRDPDLRFSDLGISNADTLYFFSTLPAVQYPSVVSAFGETTVSGTNPSSSSLLTVDDHLKWKCSCCKIEFFLYQDNQQIRPYDTMAGPKFSCQSCNVVLCDRCRVADFLMHDIRHQMVVSYVLPPKNPVQITKDPANSSIWTILDDDGDEDSFMDFSFSAMNHENSMSKQRNSPPKKSPEKKISLPSMASLQSAVMENSQQIQDHSNNQNTRPVNSIVFRISDSHVDAHLQKAQMKPINPPSNAGGALVPTTVQTTLSATKVPQQPPNTPQSNLYARTAQAVALAGHLLPNRASATNATTYPNHHLEQRSATNILKRPLINTTKTEEPNGPEEKKKKRGRPRKYPLVDAHSQTITCHRCNTYQLRVTEAECKNRRFNDDTREALLNHLRTDCVPQP